MTAGHPQHIATLNVMSHNIGRPLWVELDGTLRP